MDTRVKRIEDEQKKEKEAAALRLSKASGPYLVPTKKLFSHVYEQEGSQFYILSGTNVLSPHQKEIVEATAEKMLIILPLDNNGKDARRIRLSGEIADIQLKQEPEMDGANGLIFIKYPYSPQQHGKVQKVIISFESMDGHDLIHTYQTRHGFFEFSRIDPK